MLLSAAPCRRSRPADEQLPVTGSGGVRRLPLILVGNCRDRRRVPLPVGLQYPRPPAGRAMPDHAQSPTCTRPRSAGGRPAPCAHGEEGSPTPSRGPSPSRRRTAGRRGPASTAAGTSPTGRPPRLRPPHCSTTFPNLPVRARRDSEKGDSKAQARRRGRPGLMAGSEDPSGPPRPSQWQHLY
jgi:hypothetical protein